MLYLRWYLLPALKDLLNRRDVVLLGFGVRSMVTRIERTFCLSHQADFQPRVKDIRVFINRLPQLKHELGKDYTMRQAVRAVLKRELLPQSFTVCNSTHPSEL